MSEKALSLMIEEVRLEYRKLKDQADKALAQVETAGFFEVIDQDANSLAVIVKHVGNNLRSRWTDFYDSDGEKPDRRRDEEFEILPGDTRQTIEAIWARGWACVFETVDAMTSTDLDRTVMIGAEPHTVPRALLRSLTHTSAHVGQIVLLAKHAQGATWATLSIPKGQSEQFNAKMRAKFETSGR